MEITSYLDVLPPELICSYVQRLNLQSIRHLLTARAGDRDVILSCIHRIVPGESLQEVESFLRDFMKKLEDTGNWR